MFHKQLKGCVEKNLCDKPLCFLFHFLFRLLAKMFHCLVCLELITT